MFTFLDYLYKNGKIAVWFSWVEWLGLTAGLLIVGYKYELLPVLIMGLVSVVLAWWFAVREALNGVTYYVSKMKMPRWAKLGFGGPIAILLPTFVMYIVGYSIYGIIKGA